MADPVEKFEVKLGERNVDLTNIPPMTMRDKRVLKEKGMPLSSMHEYTPEQEVDFLHYVISKVDQRVTKDEIEALPVGIASDIFIHVGKRTAEARQERPT